MHDTGKMFYDHGMFSDDIMDFLGWQPNEEYYGDYEWDESKINLDEIFRMYPDLNIWRLIQDLDKREIEYANRGGIIGLI